MKSIIIAMNTKYVHTSLAPWYLKASCEDSVGEVKILEFTINDILDNVLAVIYEEKAHVVAFACYIWNIKQVLKICENLKKVSPDSIIILGGPEVSFDSIEYMEANPFVDYILAGEGEIYFPKLLMHISGFVSIDEVKSTYYRNSTGISFSGTGECISDLDSIPSPYTEEYFASINDRVVYFEASRGCPFSCSYCMSSIFKGVRYFSMERVLGELKKFIEKNVKQVKFVDRTFNCNRKRTIEIFKFLIKNSRNTKFHFEMVADLFDEELTETAALAPEGLFQFEIGMQTTNEMTLEAINRKTDMVKACYNIKKLISLGNIHIHLDLIAGMPYENLTSFKKSFNDVYSLKPHQLQLGFLKLLRGTMLRKKAAMHDYVFRSQPPYEVLSNNYISYDEMLGLKKIEEIVERYYNSGRFNKSVEYLIKTCFDNSYEFYRAFAQYNLEKGYLYRSISSREQFDVLNFYALLMLDKYKYMQFSELIRFDYLCSDNTYNLPKSMVSLHYDNFKDLCFDFLKNSQNIEAYLGSYKNLPPKQINKKIHFEIFLYDVTDNSDNADALDLTKNASDDNIKEKTVIIFDYNQKNSVTGLYNFVVISKNDFNV